MSLICTLRPDRLAKGLMERKNSKWLLIFSLCFLTLAIITDFIERPSKRVTDYRNTLEKYIHSQENEILSLVDKSGGESVFLENVTQGGRMWMPYEWLFHTDYSLMVYKGDSLLFWNDTRVAVEYDEIKYYRDAELHLMKLPNGQHYFNSLEFEPGYELFYFIPLKYEYNISNVYLKSIFAVDKYRKKKWYQWWGPLEIPNTIEIWKTSGEGSSEIRNKDGDAIAHLATPVALERLEWVYAIFGLYLVAFIGFTLYLTRYARWLSRERAPWMGVLLVVGFMLFLRTVMYFLGFSERFSAIPYFSNDYMGGYYESSMGNMLITASLVLWAAIFFHQEFKIKFKPNLDSKVKFAGLIGAYCAIIIGILLVTMILKGLVLGTDIPFDFENITNLSEGSFLAIIGVLFFMLVLFLVTHRVTLLIQQLELPLYRRLMGMSVAVLIMFSLAYLFQMEMPLILLVLLLFFSIIYIVSFDLFVEADSGSFIWLVIWLVIFSGFSSAFLHIYNGMKEQGQRLEYAKFLSLDRDEEIENDLVELGRRIAGDGEISNLLANDSPVNRVKKVLERNHTVNLLYYSYKPEIWIMEPDSMQTSSIRKIDNLFETSDASIHKNLRFLQEGDGLGSYFLQIPNLRMESNGRYIVLEFMRVAGRKAKVYTELFINEDSRSLRGLADYDRAVYREGKLVQQEGKDQYPLVIDETKIPPKGEEEFENLSDKSHMIYHAKNGTVVILNKERSHLFYKFISLFSYLFTIMVILLSLLALINALVQVIPSKFTIGFSPTPSLKNKIQISVIAVIILSFLVIGLVTIFRSNRANIEYHEKRLERKATSITGNAKRDIELLEIGYSQEASGNISEITKPLSEIHRMDINLYDKNGRLISSSMQDIFSKGLVAPIMNAKAFHDLVYLEKDISKQSEQIGELSYDAQYERLENNNGDLLAFIGMPYYDKQIKLKSDTSESISALLNVYVFLLLLAGAIAIAVANSITRPISVIGEKLKQVKLGKRNEELDWNSKDELGALIGEYNKMIRKIDDSAKLLAQSERESAWREMAKQVAHEIKNPLTPMKLSIQYLEHAYRSDPSQIESMLKRVSKTLIEQIDNLSQIATEFSNFAKMPRAENEHFVVNDLAESVFNLFSERDDIDMAFKEDPGEFYVFADKNQLMRVFNNLIQNAQQAIPEGRRGKIDVSVRAKSGDWVQLEVKDNGSGIGKDKKDFVFVPNFTTKSSGTGLGLAISKSIIEALGGDIYFESTPDVGTSFFVDLPVSSPGKVGWEFLDDKE